MNLKAQNPQKAKWVQDLMQNNGNPRQIYKDIMKDKTPQQLDQFQQFAKQWGVSDDMFTQLKDGMNTK